ncbi:MAG: histidinol-phosphatase [Oscillospiraceae bacterium]|nr:histidinol-phosphatase [Oscillospiraceae bacterium]
MIISTLHNHTTHSDGKNSIAETVKAALDKGFNSVGISDHAQTHLYNVSMKKDGFAKYLADICAAAALYPQIEVYAGIENEYCDWYDTAGLDYVIGSVHYLEHGGEFYCVDSRVEKFERLTANVPDYVNQYYNCLAEMAVKQKPDIIGHFDILMKNNAGYRFFDTRTVEYMNAVRGALDAIAKTDCIIEVNTGAMARGTYNCQYPETHILAEIRKMGIPVCVNSDAHSAEHIDYAFPEMARLLLDLGFTHTRHLIGGKFKDVGLE